jgi:hypothetical protein
MSGSSLNRISLGAAVIGFGAIWIAGAIIASWIRSPQGAEMLLVQLMIDAPVWVPAIFVAYAVGRKAVSVRLLVVLAIVEAVCLWWEQGIIRYF